MLVEAVGSVSKLTEKFNPSSDAFIKHQQLATDLQQGMSPREQGAIQCCL